MGKRKQDKVVKTPEPPETALPGSPEYIKYLNDYVEYLNKTINDMNSYADYINNNLGNEITGVFKRKFSQFSEVVMYDKGIQFKLKHGCGEYRSVAFKHGSPINDTKYKITLPSSTCLYIITDEYNEYLNYPGVTESGYRVIPNPKTLDKDIIYIGNASELSMFVFINSYKDKIETIVDIKYIGTPLIYIYNVDLDNEYIDVDLFLKTFPKNKDDRFLEHPVYLYPMVIEHYNYQQEEWITPHHKYHDWIIENDIISKIGKPEDFVYIGLDWIYLMEQDYLPAYEWVKHYTTSQPLKDYLSLYSFDAYIQNQNSPFNHRESNNSNIKFLLWLNEMLSDGKFVAQLDKKSIDVIKTIWK